MLGLSGRFWLHASLLRFRQIGFLRPWQSLALPLAVILQLLSLMEAGMVNSIHYVPPSAAGPHREHNKCPKFKSDAPSAPQNKLDSKNTISKLMFRRDKKEELYLCSWFYNLLTSISFISWEFNECIPELEYKSSDSYLFLTHHLI